MGAFDAAISVWNLRNSGDVCVYIPSWRTAPGFMASDTGEIPVVCSASGDSAALYAGYGIL